MSGVWTLKIAWHGCIHAPQSQGMSWVMAVMNEIHYHYQYHYTNHKTDHNRLNLTDLLCYEVRDCDVSIQYSRLSNSNSITQYILPYPYTKFFEKVPVPSNATGPSRTRTFLHGKLRSRNGRNAKLRSRRSPQPPQPAAAAARSPLHTPLICAAATHTSAFHLIRYCGCCTDWQESHFISVLRITDWSTYQGKGP